MLRESERVYREHTRLHPGACVEWIAMKRLLVIIAAALSIAGGAVALQPAPAAEAACYSNLGMWSVYNSGCSVRIRHVVTVDPPDGSVWYQYAPFASLRQWSNQPSCPAYTVGRFVQMGSTPV